MVITPSSANTAFPISVFLRMLGIALAFRMGAFLSPRCHVLPNPIARSFPRYDASFPFVLQRPLRAPRMRRLLCIHQIAFWRFPHHCQVSCLYRVVSFILIGYLFARFTDLDRARSWALMDPHHVVMRAFYCNAGPLQFSILRSVVVLAVSRVTQLLFFLNFISNHPVMPRSSVSFFFTNAHIKRYQTG